MEELEAGKFIMLTHQTTDPNSVTVDYLSFNTAVVETSHQFVCGLCKDNIHPTTKLNVDPEWFQIAILFKAERS